MINYSTWLITSFGSPDILVQIYCEIFLTHLSCFFLVISYFIALRCQFMSAMICSGINHCHKMQVSKRASLNVCLFTHTFFLNQQGREKHNIFHPQLPHSPVHSMFFCFPLSFLKDSLKSLSDENQIFHLDEMYDFVLHFMKKSSQLHGWWILPCSAFHQWESHSESTVMCSVLCKSVEPILKDPKVKQNILMHPCSYVFLFFVDSVCFEHVWLN